MLYLEAMYLTLTSSPAQIHLDAIPFKSISQHRGLSHSADTLLGWRVHKQTISVCAHKNSSFFVKW